jgi:two-component system phosphate regulon response regulator PhoB
MMKILLVEDEPDLQSLLEFNLRGAGYDVLATARGEEALSLCQRERPDLVLLDLMLPDIPGTQVCHRLRTDPALRQTPVIMLTARSEEIDRVVGFEVGADDYVVKPFSVRELLLRIQAVLRRQGPPGAAPSTPSASPAALPSEPDSAVLSLDALRIDSRSHRVYVSGQEVRLTALEFRLLWTLASQHGQVLSRSHLLEHVWNMDPHITTRTVDTHIKRLREKIGVVGDAIETVRGVGYRLVARSAGDAT